MALTLEVKSFSLEVPEMLAKFSTKLRGAWKTRRTFSSAPDTNWNLPTIARHCMSYPWICGREISCQVSCRVKKTWKDIVKTQILWWGSQPRCMWLAGEASALQWISDVVDLGFLALHPGVCNQANSNIESPVQMNHFQLEMQSVLMREDWRPHSSDRISFGTNMRRQFSKLASWIM